MNDLNQPTSLPATVPLQLTVTDRDAVHELCVYPAGEPRNQFALGALRIGMLALRQASGQLDREVIKHEAERLLLGLDGKLREHSQSLQGRLADKLKEYFDPETGRFEERVRRLVAGGGELELLLRRQIGEEDSALSRTLVQHFGEDSPLLRILNPKASEGILASLRETLESALKEQRERALNEFSQDNEGGALRRLVAQLSVGNDRIKTQVERSRKSLNRQVQILQVRMCDLKSALGNGGSEAVGESEAA